MHRFFRNLILVTALFAAPAIADEWPEPLINALTEPSDEALYSYRLTIQSDDYFIEALVDPSRPPEERIEIRFPPPGSESGNVAEMLQQLKSEPPRSIWCSTVSDAIPKDIVLMDETADTLLFSFRPIINQEMTKRERKVFKKLKGQIVIDKNTMTIRSYRMKNPKPIKPAIVAVIRTFMIESDCEMAPNGRSYRAKHVFTIDGAALGNRFGETVTTSISNLTPVELFDTQIETTF